MVHCSILYDFPIEHIARCLKMPPRQPEYRPDGRTQTSSSTSRCLAKHWQRICRNAFSTTPTAHPLPPVPPALVESLLSEKFAEPDGFWIERFCDV